MGDIKEPKMGQGPARLASETDLDKDNLGFTNPNLHRRINRPGNISPIIDGASIIPVYATNNEVGVYGTDSYRTSAVVVHEEHSYIDEIP